VKEFISEDGRIKLYNMDCMEYMEGLQENAFELAVVDPPYGIGEDGAKNHSRGGLAKPTLYEAKSWDRSAPDKNYFDCLRAKSKNQIIWGANHFIDQNPIGSSCWLVWDKQNGNNDFADCELAWASFKTAVRRFSFQWAGMLQGDMKNKETRIHPTQKPVKLYDWIYKNYANEGDRILDTHLGSGSSAISAHYAGLEFVGCELDEDYFNAAVERFQNETAQGDLFGKGAA
jgi:site-specific DNA-methyltransferase (adenine-specific)